MHIGTIIAKVIGFILLLGWLILIPVGRSYFRQILRQVREPPDNFSMYFIFIMIEQNLNIPFLIGVGLVLSCSLWLILVLSIAWILAFVALFARPLLPFSFFTLMWILRIVSGWVYGGIVYSYLFSGSGEWFYVASGVGVLCMCLVDVVIVVIIIPIYLIQFFLIKQKMIDDKLRKIRKSG